MLQHSQPDDYVIATGKAYSVRDFLAEAFGCLGLDWKDHVEIDPAYLRPSEVDYLQGDAGKAKRLLGWQPTVSFRQLVEIMVQSDLEEAKKERCNTKESQ